MNVIDQVEKEQMKGDLPSFRSGDTVKIHVRVKEADKERIQVFEGVVIKKKRGGSRASFTVRKISYGVSVERIFPLHSPIIKKIEVVQRGRVRRSRIYYLRALRGKAARIKEKKVTTE
jgi:large subunit ribosomal protein L19